MSGAAQAHQGQPGVPSDLPDHDPGHHHPPHAGQSCGDWDRSVHDPDQCPSLPGPGAVEVQASVD